MWQTNIFFSAFQRLMVHFSAPAWAQQFFQDHPVLNFAKRCSISCSFHARYNVLHVFGKRVSPKQMQALMASKWSSDV